MFGIGGKGGGREERAVKPTPGRLIDQSAYGLTAYDLKPTKRVISITF